MSDLWIASSLVLWIVVLFGIFLLACTLRQLGLIQMRLGTDPGALITTGGLDRGSEIPDFSAPDVATGMAEELKTLRTPGRDEPPLGDLPAFDISSVELDEPKLVTLSHTQ